MKKTLIQNADWIITMDQDKNKLRNSDILVEGNHIVSIGKDLISKDEVDDIVDASGCIIIPGMINTHHHCWQSLVRNIHAANNLKLEPWLKVIIGSAVMVNEDVMAAGALVAFGDLLKTGCTTSNNQHFPHPNKAKKFMDIEIATARKLGIRHHALRTSYTRGKSDGAVFIEDILVETPEEIITDGERLIKEYHDRDRYSMTQVGMALVMPTEDTDQSMLDVAEYVKENDLYCHTHLAETAYEDAVCKEKWGCTPTERLAQLNFMGENFYFAHSVHLSDSDIDILAESGAGVSHCPSSNMTLNSGVCRLPDLVDKGVNISIGVDGSASNNSSNMMHELRAAYLLNRLTWGDRCLNAEQILEIATVGGAKVLGRDDIGYLAPDMAADLVLLNWDQLPYAGGKNDPISAIVMSGDARMVDKVMVNGEFVVKDGMLTTIDEKAESNFVNRVGKRYLKANCERFPAFKEDVY